MFQNQPFCYGKTATLAAKVEPILKALNGRKHIIVGNHDYTWMKRMVASDYFVSLQTLKGLGDRSWKMKRGKLSKRPTTRWDELMVVR